jgi:hypothetical protein
MLADIVKPVTTGFRLLFSETKWVFIRGFRRWEIRQMEKRLAEEYQNLGKSFAESQAKGEVFDPKTSDNDLTLTHLEKDLEATRAEYVRGRTGEGK